MDQLSRINDQEMKRLMKEVVDKVYTVLASLDDQEFMEALSKWSGQNTVEWDCPEM